MNLRWSDEGSEERFAAYVARLSRALGHADRVGPFRSYCTGLLLPGDRKSVEPMAARLRPDRTAAEHQSLLHFVGQSPWDDTALLRAAREAVLTAMTAAGPVEGWIVDDTGFPKKGRHSVGVVRQYCGQLGKQDNCQVAVSLSVATAIASLPVAWRLYLPESWASDATRRSRAGVPDDVVFRSKPQIALSQIAAALAEGVPPGPVLADAAYGNDSGFRAGIRDLGLDYGGRARHDSGLAARHGARGAGLGRPGSTTDASAPRWGRGTGPPGPCPGRRACLGRLANGGLARGHGRDPAFALRRAADAPGSRRCPTQHPAARRMAVDRMAGRHSQPSSGCRR